MSATSPAPESRPPTSVPAGDSGGTTPDHALPLDRVFERVGSEPGGLSSTEAASRLKRFGPNRLVAAKRASAWRILLDQLESVVVLLLFAAAVVSFATGDVVESLAILAVLVINTVLGFTTELRARRAMEALLRLDAPRARALRDGREHELDAADLVPGDVVRLEPGDSIPADGRLIEGTELLVDEAPLTGESVPVSKDQSAVLPADTPVAERTNMLFKGTTVTAGSGRVLVTATGMDTELGKIGGLVASIEAEETPLERRLDTLGKRLIVITLAVAAIVIGIGWLRGEELGTMVQTGIALAIAAVPEGLAAVATIALAVGLRRMARRNALIRRLPSVEALGSTTVVCTDKTGTLTAGEMTVTLIEIDGREYNVSGAGYAPEGEFTLDGQPVRPEEHAVLARFLRTASLSARADVEQRDGNWRAVGDPTDAALLVAALKAGLTRDRLLAETPETGEVPFSSARQFMATFHREPNGEIIAHVKGAPHRVAELCDRRATEEGDVPLDDAGRDALRAANESLAQRGLRVIALAQGTVPRADVDALRGLTFLGLAGIIDPPAEGVRETIARFRNAGIRTIMITGDQRLTAEAIALDLGLATPEDGSLDGRELQRMDPEEFERQVAHVATYSRVSPEDKLRIVSALKKRGEVVAMLGDGVNDAAALKRADVGVAMGRRGTDVAKETAAVVLQDDRFATIGAAVEEGRVIFDNIRKFIFYLFSCNLAEVLVLFLAGLVGWPLPLLPLQILWLNLVTDTFPALSLAVEPADPGVMDRPPRDPQAAILSGRFLATIAVYAAMITAVTLAGFRWMLGRDPGDIQGAVTMAFTTLALAQLFHLGNARSQEPVLAPARAFSNRWALGAVAVVLGLQALAVYWPPLAGLLRLRPLTLSELGIAAGLSVAPAFVGQLIRLRKGRHHRAAVSEPP